MRIYLVNIIWLSLVIHSLIQAQEKIVLEYADTLRSKGSIRELIGNVKVNRGDEHIIADRAIYDAEAKIISLYGRVNLSEPSRRVSAEQMRYDENTGNFDARGSVDVWIGDSLRIRCNTAHYVDEISKLKLDGNLFIEMFNDSSQITGRWGQFDLKDSSGVIEGSPVYSLLIKDGDKRDTLVIKSDRLEFSQRDRSALFIGNVELTRLDILALADTLYHQPDSNRTQLTGAPILWRGDDELSGKQIYIVYKGQNIKTLIVSGDAVVLSPSKENDKRKNKLAGRKISFEVIDDSTRYIKVEGDAVGRYFVWDDKNVYQGVNLATADVIEIMILGKRTKMIEINGKANGAFYPPGFEPAEVFETTIGNNFQE